MQIYNPIQPKRATAIAALAVIVVATSLAGGLQQAAADIVPCTGPLAQCFASVGARCEREPNGKIMAWYVDRGSTGMDLERCIGQVHEKHGRPNPYKPAPQNSAPKQR